MSGFLTMAVRTCVCLEYLKLLLTEIIIDELFSCCGYKEIELGYMTIHLQNVGQKIMNTVLSKLTLPKYIQKPKAGSLYKNNGMKSG